MSFRILVVLEDPALDRYIVKSLVERLCRRLEKPTVRVDVLLDPRLRGVEQALANDTWRQILHKYPMIDLFLLVVDRDCVANRAARVAQVESTVKADRKNFAGCLAVEEVEVWLLAGFASELPEPWAEVRRECHPKERFFEPFMTTQDTRGVGAGRLRLMKQAVRKINRLIQLCPEIDQMSQEIANVA